MKLTLLLLPALGILGACASIPDAVITYKKAKPSVSVTLTQLITCDPNYTQVFGSARMTSVVSHVAGADASTKINVRDFDGNFKDGDVNFGFYPDGRLRSINANVAGMGEATINSIASVAGSVVGLGDFSPLAVRGPNGGTPITEAQAVCEVINEGNVKKNSVMTLTFTQTFNDGSLSSKTGPLLANGRTEINLSKIKTHLGANGYANEDLIKSVEANFSVDAAADKPFSPISYRSGLTDDKYVPLAVNQIQKYKLKVIRVFNTDLNLNLENSTIREIKFTAAGEGEKIVLIPKGAAFGTSRFSMSMNEMGAVSAIGYNNTKGTSSALNTANSFLQNFQKDTDSEVADNIAQQARRLRCEADPVNCV